MPAKCNALSNLNYVIVHNESIWVKRKLICFDTSFTVATYNIRLENLEREKGDLSV